MHAMHVQVAFNITLKLCSYYQDKSTFQLVIHVEVVQLMQLTTINSPRDRFRCNSGDICI